MATTKLACPQCQGELPANFPRGASGVCPKCQQAFAAPKVKVLRRAAPVAKAFAAPGAAPKSTTVVVQQEESSKRGLGMAIALLLLLVVVVGAGGYVLTRPSTDKPAAADNPPKGSPQVASLNPSKANSNPATSNQTAANPEIKPATVNPPAVDNSAPSGSGNNAPTSVGTVPDPDTVTTTVPQKQRPTPKIEPTAPIDVAKIEFPEFKTRNDQPKKLKSFSPAVDQDKVDLAIEKGKQYLKANKASWLHHKSHQLGFVALPALALMECDVPKNDPAIQEAIVLTRQLAQKCDRTYEMSLAILFLDKYGDPVDDELIRTLGLRLAAGMTPNHGWNYTCPILPKSDETPLLTLLEKLRPKEQWHVPLGREPGKAIIELAIPLAAKPSDRLDLGLPLGEQTPEMKANPNVVMPIMLGDQAKHAELLKDVPESIKKYAVTQPLEASPAQKVPGMPKNPLQRNLIVRPKGGFIGNRDDNSNTQFAILALWVARRHGVPVERSLLLADQRFAVSQGPKGGWAYSFNGGDGTPQMTCVGLLGLAMGHGALLPPNIEPGKAPKAAADPAIQKGLTHLSASIGEPGGIIANANLYYLWSLERVGMLYDLQKINGKDWYGWGANHLLLKQEPAGSWSGGHYPGSAVPLDTSFALLFLHRSNLVPDLTERLRLHMPIQEERK